MWLDYRAAAALAVASAVAWAVTRDRDGRGRAVASVARELTLVLALYTLWQYAGTISVMHSDGAVARGRALWDVERALGLPSELALQRAMLPHPPLVRLANGYYAIVHVPALLMFLVWLFVRHRDRYPGIRTTLAWLTFLSLAIQLIPVAPPRLVPGLGFVDTALRYHQSVYPSLGAAGPDQLSAMPSLHVGWALLVAVAVVAVGTSRWRWWVVAHPVITVLVVAATANHWWLDGLAEVVLLGAIVLVRRAVRARTGRRRLAVVPAST